jgi:hypothetical protein
MISLIPATIILKNPNAQAILTILDDSLTLVPTVIQSIPVSNESKLSIYNKKSIDDDLNDSNLEEEIKKLETSKEKSKDLTNLKKEYEKFSKDTFSHNRFQTINTQNIPGVGVDGSGFHPIKYYEENIAIKKIEEEASIPSKWNPSPGNGEEILKESVKNACFWQALNVGQLPIGSPVQVCSAVIELLSPIKDRLSASEHIEFLDPYFTGKDFIKNRPEIEGLRYLIDGNMFEIENKDILIKGVRDFENQRFKRFGRNGYNSDSDKPEVKIKLVVDGEDTKPKELIDLQTNQKSTRGPIVFKMIGQNLRTDYLQKMIVDNPPEDKKRQRGVILFLFTIFFEYGCYIFNLYNEHLIKKLKKKSTDILNQYRRANYSMIANFINLINYSLIRKFKIKDQSGEFYDAIDFITVDQAESELAAYDTNKLTLTKVIRRIRSDQIKIDKKEKKDFIRIFFKPNAYTDEDWNLDESEFSLDNFPIVFDTNMGIERLTTSSSGTEAFLDVDYRMSIERLTKFLLQDNNGEIPKTKNDNGKIIAVGAPFQNDEIFEQTFEALDAYFDFIKGSKQIYKQYAELKLGIFRSGYPTRDIVENRDYFLSKYSLIYSTFTNPEIIDIEYLKVINFVMNEYKKNRQRELKLLDNKTFFENNKKRILGDRMSDISREEYRGILRVKYGLAAEMIIKVAELSYDIFLSRNPRAASNFKSLLKQKKAIYDAEVAIELKKIIDRQKIYINKKFGKGSAQLGLVGLNNIPPTPPQFMTMIGESFPQLGILVQSGQPMGQPMGQPGLIGRIAISLEQRLKVEQLKFWQDLRTIFSGRTILLPIAKLKSNNIFDDNEFYLLDIFRSMIFNKLSAFQISDNGRISQRLVDAKVLNNAYIMLCANTVDLGNPNSWRCINYNNIARMKKLDGTFKDIKKIRGIFFNLIANNSFLIESMRVSIPAGSNTALGLVKYCNYAMKKELPKCNILISRQLFAETLQPKMGTFSGTMGIDLISGVAYFEMGPYTQSRNSDIVVR